DASDSSNDAGSCEGAKCDDAEGSEGTDGFVQQSYCVGVRGNGQLITAHFASLARIIEHYGLVSGVSGGSSASITSFLLESIQMNPAVNDCGGKGCTDEEAANRAALLFKSLQGYVGVLAGTPEAAAIAQLIPVAQQVAEQDIAGLAETDPEAAREALDVILQSTDIRELLNPELLALLQNSPNPEFHVQDIAAAIAGAASFNADNPDILVRPGLIDFAAFAEKIGRIGSFYAGYGNYDAETFEAFMASCATPGKGLNWDGVATLPVGDTGMVCAQVFDQLATTWRDDFIANEDQYASRIDDEIGAELPALISTSVITGPSAVRWAGARDAYFAGEPTELGVDFDDVRFGYFGARADLDLVESNNGGFDDIKSDKFMAIGTATWRTALSYSPAEPGLARALELPVGQDGVQNISAGGWSDLHPTLVLRNMGCDNVVYVTRTDVELGGFADGVATLLGMDEGTGEKLYGLDQDSALTRSIDEADAVWCTNWNDIPATDIAAVSADSYNATLITADPNFTEGAQAYENLDPEFSAQGCSVE
ncbi:MAG: hypothetical protein AAGA54_24630, partial [Myxococcota bacterium]